MKTYILILAICFTKLVFSQDLKKSDVTYYISFKSSSPIQIAKGNKEPRGGIVTDVIEALNIVQLNLKYKTLPFKRMIREMEISKNYWITYGSAAWPGPQSYSLSKTPLLSVRHILLTMKGAKFNKLTDLYGKTVVLIQGFDYPGIEEHVKSKKIKAIYVKNHLSAIQTVLKGRAFAFPEMRTRVKYHLKKNKLPNSKFEFFPISNIISDNDINLCFSKVFPKDLKEKIETRLIKLKESGKLEDIIKSYID